MCNATHCTEISRAQIEGIKELLGRYPPFEKQPQKMFGPRNHFHWQNFLPTHPAIRRIQFLIQILIYHGGDFGILRLGKPHPMIMRVEINCSKSRGEATQIFIEQQFEPINVLTIIDNKISNTYSLQIQTHIEISKIQSKRNIRTLVVKPKRSLIWVNEVHLKERSQLKSNITHTPK